MKILVTLIVDVKTYDPTENDRIADTISASMINMQKGGAMVVTGYGASLGITDVTIKDFIKLPN